MISRKADLSHDQRLLTPGSQRWLSSVVTSTGQTPPAANAQIERSIDAQATITSTPATCATISICVIGPKTRSRLASYSLVDWTPWINAVTDTTAITYGNIGS